MEYSMETCPNCGSKEMMWASEDSDGQMWYYCLNDTCLDLHPQEEVEIPPADNESAVEAWMREEE